VCNEKSVRMCRLPCHATTRQPTTAHHHASSPPTDGMAPTRSSMGPPSLSSLESRSHTTDTMPPPSRSQRPSTSSTSASTSYPSKYETYATITSRTRTGQSIRPSTGRPRTGASTVGFQNQQLVCAVTESRGISPTVGLAFINLDTGEAALSQISDSQTYVRTINKLRVYAPSQILIPSTASDPPSKLFSIIEEDLDTINAGLIPVDRRYYAETTGLEFIHQLAFAEDVEAIKITIGGNYFAVCCFAAVSTCYRCTQ
jgi:DNA mismatch repair protein MSH4